MNKKNNPNTQKLLSDIKEEENRKINEELKIFNSNINVQNKENKKENSNLRIKNNKNRVIK